MKKLLLLLPLLLGSLVTPASASSYKESFNYEAGYKACIRDFFYKMTRQRWNDLSSVGKDDFRTKAHKSCR